MMRILIQKSVVQHRSRIPIAGWAKFVKQGKNKQLAVGKQATSERA
jgi:hypothetical protein